MATAPPAVQPGITERERTAACTDDSHCKHDTSTRELRRQPWPLPRRVCKHVSRKLVIVTRACAVVAAADAADADCEIWTKDNDGPTDGRAAA